MDAFLNIYHHETGELLQTLFIEEFTPETAESRLNGLKRYGKNFLTPHLIALKGFENSIFGFFNDGHVQIWDTL